MIFTLWALVESVLSATIACLMRRVVSTSEVVFDCLSAVFAVACRSRALRAVLSGACALTATTQTAPYAHKSADTRAVPQVIHASSSNRVQRQGRRRARISSFDLSRSTIKRPTPGEIGRAHV